ncbi:hypothetical protein EJB05_09797, partial [Eragrostis curvula]
MEEQRWRRAQKNSHVGRWGGESDSTVLGGLAAHAGSLRLVRSHVKSGWTSYIRDIESYWKFSDTRGH